MNPTDSTDVPQDNALSRALEGLWQRFLPEMIERVTILESAATAITGSGITREQSETAQAAAHKLAGVLGTFGFMRGTELARELERTLATESTIDAETAAKFVSSAAELRELVQNRKASA